MDNSVVEILDDSDVVEVTDDKENASVNASVAVVAPDRRKATRGGVKLDDTVELLSDSDDDDQGDQPHNKGRFSVLTHFYNLGSELFQSQKKIEKHIVSVCCLSNSGPFLL